MRNQKQIEERKEGKVRERVPWFGIFNPGRRQESERTRKIEKERQIWLCSDGQHKFVFFVTFDLVIELQNKNQMFTNLFQTT